MRVGCLHAGPDPGAPICLSAGGRPSCSPADNKLRFFGKKPRCALSLCVFLNWRPTVSPACAAGAVALTHRKYQP